MDDRVRMSVGDACGELQYQLQCLRGLVAAWRNCIGQHLPVQQLHRDESAGIVVDGFVDLADVRV